MGDLVQPLLVGMAMSMAAAFLAWLTARALRDRVVADGVALWRAARIVAVLPLLLAPVLHAIPRTTEMPVALDFLAPRAAVAAGAGSGIAEARTASSWRVPPAGQLALTLYLLGLAVAVAGARQRHRARSRLLARSRQAGREERAVLEALARRMGVAAPDLRIGQAAVSPFLTGWRGVVVVPADLDMRSEALRFALAHELCHLRRGDERDRLLGVALTTVLWFSWPLRRIERELDAAREIACDRETLDALGGARRRSYAAALIEVMRTTAPAASAFGPQDRRLREMRIKAILAPQRPRKDRAVWLTATILATAVPFAGAQALVTERRVAAEPVEAIAAVPAVTPRPAAPPVPAASPADAPGPAPAVESRPGAAPAPVLSHPVAHGRISSRYGNRAARPAGSAPFHGGYDIAAAEGTPVVAPGAGVIVHAAAGYRGSERWGNTVAIDHGDGWQTVYAHLQDFGVAPGDRVEAGQQIGRVGTTGAVTGPHVHVELHHNGERVDPADHVPGLR